MMYFDVLSPYFRFVSGSSNLMTLISSENRKLEHVL